MLKWSEKSAGLGYLTVAVVLFGGVAALDRADTASDEMPRAIQTLNAELSDCEARGFETNYGRFGCSLAAKATRGGSTVFLRAGN